MPQKERPNGYMKVNVSALYRHKHNKELYLYSEKLELGERGDRNTVAIVKRVYGGAFSGHNILLVEQELVVLRTFITAARKLQIAWQISMQPWKSPYRCERLSWRSYTNFSIMKVGLHIRRLATKLMSPKDCASSGTLEVTAASSLPTHYSMGRTLSIFSHCFLSLCGKWKRLEKRPGFEAQIPH